MRNEAKKALEEANKNQRTRGIFKREDRFRALPFKEVKAKKSSNYMTIDLFTTSWSIRNKGHPLKLEGEILLGRNERRYYYYLI